MAEAFMKSFDDSLEVYSAGTNPSHQVHPLAVQVMDELGFDLSDHYPQDVDVFLDHSFDYVITVCDNAKETCPVFSGDVKHNIHIGFEDPADAEGTLEEKLNIFRRIRDEIRTDFKAFYDNKIL
jgi:arsenate reductase